MIMEKLKNKIPKKPRNLTENQQIQDRLFMEEAYGNPRQKFSYFVGTHPRLYDGVDLDDATINYINNYFFDYNIDPRDFERHFINKIQRVAPIYNNLKAIEFNKKVFDITTNNSVRKIVSEATNDLTRDGTINRIKQEAGTITDNGTMSEVASGTNRGSTSSENYKNNKTANRNLPMQSSGDNFEDMFNWNKGGSNISENEENGTNEETQTYNTTDNTNTDTQNTRTIGNTITNDDINKLTELANKNETNKDNYKAINTQAVKLIANIWNYLVEPKSLDYIVSELENCFSLIF